MRKVAISASIVVLVGATSLSTNLSTADASPTRTTHARVGDSDCVGQQSTLLSVARTTAAGRLVGSLSYRSAAQAEAAADSDTKFGRLYTYEFNNSLITERIPPAKWNPLTASSAELSLYRIKPRPKSLAALASWQRLYRPFHLVPSGFCETSKKNSIPSSSTPNWAGGLNGPSGANTYADNEIKFTEPSFVSVCPHASSYSIWGGLGGYNSSRLIQDGVDTSSSSLNSTYFFWELLTTNHAWPEVKFSGVSVKPGDAVDVSLSYSYSLTGQVYFDVYDTSTGSGTDIELNTYQSIDMNDYYNGATSDFITEAPSGGSAPGGLYYLRKPSSGYTHIPFASSNGKSLSSYSSTIIVEKSGLMQTSTFNGTNAWNDTWHACS